VWVCCNKWKLEASYPPSPKCQDKIPVPNATGSWTGPIGDVCVDKVTPGEDDCCLCTFSEEEYNEGNEMGQALGQRAWAGGLFSMKEGTYDEEIESPPKVCMVVGEMPHPLSNTSLYDLNGVATSDPRPFSIMRYICTSLLNPEICVPNSDGTSKILFGSSVFVEGVSELCGDTPVVVMFDSNAGAGDFPTWVMFNTEPLLGLAGAVDNDGLEPYTCCNDTHLVDIDPSQFRIDAIGGGNKGLNRYASDRIAASVETFKIDKLEGGSITVGGPVDTVGLGYQCHAAQEHLPLRAYITDNRLPAVAVQEEVDTSSSSETSVGSNIKSMKTMAVGIGAIVGLAYLI